MSSLKMLTHISMCILLGLTALESTAQSTQFNKQVWNDVKNKNLNENWIAVFWSLECPPCFKELKTISQMLKVNSDLKVVLINTDSDDEIKQEMDKVINEYELNTLALLHFADEQAMQSRYIVDPTWYGELPRSYFFNKKGQSQGRSGLVDKRILQKWLN